MKGNSSPKVSVIMPSYNSEQFIAQAIRSVQEQTVADWELIVIDDLSTDKTCEIVDQFSVQDPRIILIKNDKNGGPACSRNKGIELSKGKYVAFLDSDDVWYPNKLEKQLSCLEKEQADIAYSSYAVVNEQCEKVCEDFTVPYIADLDQMLKKNIIGCSTVMLSREALQGHSFRTDFYHEDYVLWLELLRSGYTARGCTDVLVDWRYMDRTRSANKVNSAKKRWDIYRKFMKFPVWKSLYYFGFYALSGLIKYQKKS